MCKYYMRYYEITGQDTILEEGKLSASLAASIALLTAGTAANADDYRDRDRDRDRDRGRPEAQQQITKRDLEEVNRRVNREIEYVTDRDKFGKAEVFRYGLDDEGDCEEYAFRKMRYLQRLGVPSRAMRMVSVETRYRDGGPDPCHMVLVVNLDGKHYVLDNRVSGVETVEQTGRRYNWNNCSYR